MESKLLHQDLTERIIGAYYTVYNKLGQSYPEFIYERAMLALLEQVGIHCARQDEHQIWYKQQLVGVQKLDLFVAGEVIVEIKVAERITPLHLAQMLSYLKTVSKEVGLLMRFGGPKPDHTRRVLTRQRLGTEVPAALSKSDQQDLPDPDLVYEIIRGLFEVFQVLGPGFIHRIYANACYHELKLRGLEVKTHREFRVFMDQFDLGNIKFGHLQVDQRVLVFPVALARTEQLQFANLKAWMRYLQIPVGIIANFHTTWLEPVILRV
jgi:GxxExxY protein